MILAESLLLSAAGTGFGILAGLWLGYAIISGISMVGIVMPYSFSLAGVLAAIGFGLIFLGVLASTIPAQGIVILKTKITNCFQSDHHATPLYRTRKNTPPPEDAAHCTPSVRTEGTEEDHSGRHHRFRRHGQEYLLPVLSNPKRRCSWKCWPRMVRLVEAQMQAELNSAIDARDGIARLAARDGARTRDDIPSRVGC